MDPTWGERLLQALLDGGIIEQVAGEESGLFRLRVQEQLELVPLTAKKRAESRDPRFHVLRAVWEEEYRAAKRSEYRWDGAKDAIGLRKVLAVPPEEFRVRAKRGLRAQGFLQCSTVAKLCSGDVWNALVNDAPAGGKPRVIAPVGNFNGVKPTDYFGGGRHE